MKPKYSFFLFLVFLSTLVFMSFNTITAHDLGWHLKTGEWIVQNAQIPHQDLYSNNAGSLPWIDLHWLFQIMIYVIHSFSGFLGLTIFKILLLTIIYLLLYQFGRGRNFPFLTGIVFLLSAFTAHERFQPRPEILTFLIMVIDLGILERNRETGSKWIWAIPLIQILWTNLEGLFIIGPILIATYAFGEILEKKWPPKLILILILSLLTSLINPYGFNGLLFPLTLLKEISLKTTAPSLFIGEFLSPFAPSTWGIASICFFSLILLSVLITLPKHRRIPRSHLILLIEFAMIGFLAQRNMALFAMVSPLIILKNWKSRKENPSTLLKSLAFGGYILICLTISFSFISNRFYIKYSRLERFGNGMAQEIFPEKAVRYLSENESGTTILNAIEFGPALIYWGWPSILPFVDTRLEVYGESKLKEYFQAISNESAWNELIQTHQIRCIFIDHIKKESLALIHRLHVNPDWFLAYYDETSTIFIKGQKEAQTVDGRDRKPQDLSLYSLLKNRFPWLPDEICLPNNLLYMGRLYLALEQYEEAKKSYLKALSINPKIIEAWINLAFIEEKIGNISQAEHYLKEALLTDPRSYTAHFNLGNLYLKMKLYKKAVHAFNQALRINRTIQAENNLKFAIEHSKVN